MNTQNNFRIIVNYVISFLVGFFSVLVTLTYFLRFVVNHTHGPFVTVLFMFVLSATSAFIPYKILKHKFSSDHNFCRHIFWGLIASTATTMIISFCFFILSNSKAIITGSMSGFFIYLILFLAGGFIYGLPGIIISGLTLGTLNHRASCDALQKSS